MYAIEVMYIVDEFTHKAAMQTGGALKGDTIAGLAVAIGVDPEGLTRTINRWKELMLKRGR